MKREEKLSLRKDFQSLQVTSTCYGTLQLALEASTCYGTLQLLWKLQHSMENMLWKSDKLNQKQSGETKADSSLFLEFPCRWCMSKLAEIHTVNVQVVILHITNLVTSLGKERKSKSLFKDVRN